VEDEEPPPLSGTGAGVYEFPDGPSCGVGGTTFSERSMCPSRSTDLASAHTSRLAAGCPLCARIAFAITMKVSSLPAGPRGRIGEVHGLIRPRGILYSAEPTDRSQKERKAYSFLDVKTFMPLGMSSAVDSLVTRSTCEKGILIWRGGPWWGVRLLAALTSVYREPGLLTFFSKPKKLE
jgi:hypothetical protein